MENNHITFVPPGVKHETNYWGSSDPQHIISKVVTELKQKEFIATDQYIRLHIKPKPRLLPTKIWEFLLSKFIVLDRFKKTI